MVEISELFYHYRRYFIKLFEYALVKLSDAPEPNLNIYQYLNYLS